MATKEYKVDIFEVLKQIDLRNSSFYDSLDDNEKKSVAMLPLMRWVSAIKDRGDVQEYYLNYVNEYVNTHFWKLSKHPTLQWKLLSLIGIGERQSHEWIAMSKKDSIPTLVYSLLRTRYPSANDDEIKMMGDMTSNDEFIDYAKALAWDDTQLKALKAELKKRNG